MKELHKGHGVDREALWKVAFPEAREAIAGTGPGTGGMKQKAVHKEAPPGGSSVSLATPDSGREAIAALGEGDAASQPTFWKETLGDGEGMKQKVVHKETLPRGSTGSLAIPDSGREAIAGRGPDTGDAVTTTRVPDSQKGIRMSFCQGTRCWLVIMAGLLCLELVFILCCFGIWYTCQRKQCVSAASQILPKTSAGKSCIGYRPSPSHYRTSLPPLHYQLIAVEVQPPCRTGPSALAGAGPRVLPGLKVGPSCQGRA
ncbi:uncharacterized protein LOC111935249 [Cyanistes caeruleus]|uniref:uncharacterized protein LOC111935249 n=1 Tax=Cyanistes caeruleus TaxID=156563 RepID=UPI000CDACC71|nr:uncharacterized protein LOC111935249 [Cyanistes caeruleus]